MAEGISQHKRMAMGESVPMAKGKGSLPKFAGGGAVMAESKVANLPAKGEVMPLVKGTGAKIATFKRGGNVEGGNIREKLLPKRRKIKSASHGK
jgi:hypothetical protein